MVPGSHLLPPIDVQALRREVFGDGPISAMSPEGWAAYQDAVARQCEDAGLKPQSVHVQPGDVIVWHPQCSMAAPRILCRNPPQRGHARDPEVDACGSHGCFLRANPPLAKAPWRYYRRGQREIARFGQVDFGHEYTRRTWFLRKA